MAATIIQFPARSARSRAAEDRFTREARAGELGPVMATISETELRAAFRRMAEAFAVYRRTKA